MPARAPAHLARAVLVHPAGIRPLDRESGTRRAASPTYLNFAATARPPLGRVRFASAPLFDVTLYRLCKSLALNSFNRALNSFISKQG